MKRSPTDGPKSAAPHALLAPHETSASCAPGSTSGFAATWTLPCAPSIPRVTPHRGVERPAGPMHPFTPIASRRPALPECKAQPFDFCNTTKTHEHDSSAECSNLTRPIGDPILRLQMTHLGVGARAPEIICGELRGVLSMLRIASKQPRRKTRITDRFRSVRAPCKRSRSELRQPSASYDESCDVSDAPRRACARCVPSRYLDQPLVSPKSGSDVGWTHDFTRPLG